MIHHVARLVIEGAAAVAAYLVADQITKEVTGKSIPEHVFQWWCQFREKMKQWAATIPAPGRKVFLYILDSVDNVMVATKQMADRVTLGAIAQDAAGKQFVMEETTEVSLDELIQQHPGFKETSILEHKLES